MEATKAEDAPGTSEYHFERMDPERRQFLGEFDYSIE